MARRKAATSLRMTSLACSEYSSGAPRESAQLGREALQAAVQRYVVMNVGVFGDNVEHGYSSVLSDNFPRRDVLAVLGFSRRGPAVNAGETETCDGY
jgi:hypothetical protein